MTERHSIRADEARNVQHWTVDEFKARIQRIDPERGCWVMSGRDAGPMGYKNYRKGRNGSKGAIYAHRLSWWLFKGPIPEGMRVLHECDVPACANPEHLFLGTSTVNMQDCVTKGRHRGWPMAREKRPKAKLTWQKAAEIRISVETEKVLAARYGVSVSTIGLIRTGRSWPISQQPDMAGKEM